jgi:anti-sigma B factor antagonist
MAIAIMDSELTIVQPSGHINAGNASEFQRQLTDAVSSAPNAVLVDMYWVESLDSAGLMSLVHAFRLAQRLKRRFGICSVAPSIKMIFELTQLDAAFEIFESRNAFAATLALR